MAKWVRFDAPDYRATGADFPGVREVFMDSERIVVIADVRGMWSDRPICELTLDGVAEPVTVLGRAIDVMAQLKRSEL